ncbi:hypothetical protein VTL71DRAFT_1176 [Oculimacula yallundae]|uniref:Heterokaryon incompatibility domain-containing protein n=1 Tax=Oculimacula yallundae TaxID=86028 RepID=A0ABR4D241_9HELO
MLCATCSAIDFSALIEFVSDQTNWQREKKQHGSFEDLQDAADNGCDLCKLIIKAMHHAPRLRLGASNEEALASNREQIYFKGSTQDSARTDTTQYIQFSQQSNSEESFYLLSTLDLFAASDSHLAKRNLVHGRPIPKFADSEACIDLIRNWTHECLTDHADLCPVSISPLPTRVIDVGSATVSPRVVVTKGAIGRWVALSHCWGTKVRFILESKNLEARQQAVPLEEMPSSFSDAIKVTRRLGYRYLWIDSLCILQDSREDWLSESSHMLDYYRHSSLTIALNDTAGDEHGFLQVLRTPETHSIMVPVEVTVPDDGANNSVKKQSELLGFRSPYNLHKRAHVLDTRGWTLQEDLLSPRTVHFHSRFLTWECQTHEKHETRIFKRRPSSRKPEPTPKRGFLQSSSNLILGRSWYKITQDYMQRILTIPQDKFPALAGLARRIGENTGYTYKAGIWLENFHSCHLWVVHHRTGKRSGVYIAPSWSWASCSETTRIFYPAARWVHLDSVGSPVGPKAELIDCQVTLAGTDVYGEVMAGAFTLKSTFLQLSNLPLLHWGIMLQYRHSYGRLKYSGDKWWTYELECFFDETAPGSVKPIGFRSNDDMFREVFLLQIVNWPISWWDGVGTNVSILTSFFLLLSPVADGKFRRAQVYILRLLWSLELLGREFSYDPSTTGLKTIAGPTDSALDTGRATFQSSYSGRLQYLVIWCKLAKAVMSAQ